MLGKLIRPSWRKGTPRHKESGFSEVVIVLLENNMVTSDRYYYSHKQWERNHPCVKGWFYLPKRDWINETRWENFIRSCTGRG